MQKNILLYNPRRSGSENTTGIYLYLPTLWSQTKTYYEKTHTDDWNWVLPIIDMFEHEEIDQIQSFIENNPPDIFGISLYVWNADLAHEVAAWVKNRWPSCVVISGGPHQYMRTDMNWFKDRPYLDASLPGDCYGEWCITEIMQQINKKPIDWQMIDNIFVPSGKTRVPYQHKNESKNVKKTFDYDWPSFANQKHYLQEFINHARIYNTQIKPGAILETTRGCPYGCTFCDWGGGINSKVKSKPIDYVKQDIESLADLGIQGIFIADANFGILGDRDVEILDFIINGLKTKNQFKVNFGGMAKTNKRLETLKKIIDLQSKETGFDRVKLSIQSFDQEVLNNIKRTNITLDEYLEIYDLHAQDVSKNVAVAEMILGLPGMTLQKFYREFDILYQHNLMGVWYEWLVLPEAPAFQPEYREKFQIRTLKKNHGWSYRVPKSDFAVAVKSYSYSEKHYLEMMIAVGWFFCFMPGGIFLRCRESLKNNIGIGHLIEKLIFHSGLVDLYESQWLEICDKKELPALVKVPGKNETPPYHDLIYFGHLVPAIWFWNKSMILSSTKEVFLSLGCDPSIIDLDINAIVDKNTDLSAWSRIFKALTHKDISNHSLMLKDMNTL